MSNPATDQAQHPGAIPEKMELPAIAMHGPIEMAIVVHVLTGEGKPARLSMNLPAGVIPTKESIKEILANCLTEAPGENAGIPPGTRLMTKREFWAHITKREAGEALPMPGNQEFEDLFADIGDEISKATLVHAIKGKGFPSMEKADYWTKLGMARFTGNQHNPDWSWIAEKLEQLPVSTLLKIYFDK
jgi:hypothetical protein